MVIVAEKDPLPRATLAAILSCDGYRVFQAENLKAANSCVDTLKDFEVLFADLDMPGWKSLIQHALSMAPNAFVIAMAGGDPDPDMLDLKQYGIEASLHKPISCNALEEVLSKRCEKRRAA